METKEEYDARIAKRRDTLTRLRAVDKRNELIEKYHKGEIDMTALTPDAISALMGKTRDRGGYERFLQRETEDAYILLNDTVEYRAKVAEHSNAIKVGLTSAAKKLGIRIKVLEDEGQLILVFLDRHEALLNA